MYDVSFSVIFMVHFMAPSRLFDIQSSRFYDTFLLFVKCMDVDIPGIVSREWHQLNVIEISTFFVNPAVITCIVISAVKSRYRRFQRNVDLIILLFILIWHDLAYFLFWFVVHFFLMGVGRALWR